MKKGIFTIHGYRTDTFLCNRVYMTIRPLSTSLRLSELREGC